MEINSKNYATSESEGRTYQAARLPTQAPADIINASRTNRTLVASLTRSAMNQPTITLILLMMLSFFAPSTAKWAMTAKLTGLS